MKTFVAIGANIGRRLSTVDRSLRLLSRIPRTRIENVSSLYETEAVGGPKQPQYLNAVVELDTTLPPSDFMEYLSAIEKKLGRVRRIKWGPRVIDLDLLAMGQQRIKNKSLDLPHPRYHERRFVLVPFCEIAPRFRHPRLKTSNVSLLRKLTLNGQRVTIFAQWNGTRFSPSKKKRNRKPRSSH